MNLEKFLGPVVVERLRRGAKVADLGCGLGAWTVLLAQAFPRSRFFGYDVDALAIELAAQLALQAGVAERVTFEVASTTEIPGRDYDLVAQFDRLRDLDDAAGAARCVRRILTADGLWIRRASETPFNLVLEARP